MMDKYTKRYLFDTFGHCTEHFSSEQAVSYMNQVDNDEKSVYLLDAIRNEIPGAEGQFLQFKLMERKFERGY
jgi:hypothetical protein